MKEPIDWVWVVFSGAITGGFLWAISLKVIFGINDHYPSASYFELLSLISVSVLVIAGAWHLWTRTAFWRSTTLGFMLAPLTGWSIPLAFSALFAVAGQGA